ncbi:MAG: hypothetical protein FWD96_00855 [Defluviitaleaceae bacterium]|nr:hypothetical protein [Defluviitaleaceae bacterium]
MNITRQSLHQLVDIVDNNDIDLVYQLLVRFTLEDAPLPDEIEAIKLADDSISKSGTIDYSEINWE